MSCRLVSIFMLEKAVYAFYVMNWSGRLARENCPDVNQRTFLVDMADLLSQWSPGGVSAVGDFK